MEQTRDVVRRRSDVDPADVDEVVAIAAELQDEARRRAEAPTVGQIEAVASELDVDPAWVQPAIEALHERRRRAETEAAAASAERSRIGQIVGIGLLALLGIGGSIAAVAGGSASSRIRAADVEVRRTEAALVAVLDRQQQLVPPLVALAGGTIEVPTLTPGAPIDVRLKEADALSAALTRALSTLPPTDGARAQERLNLQYELTGTQNRISVERRRWQDALVVYDSVDRGFGARVAHGLGLVD